MATWLCDNGFKQAKNEPYLFVNAEGVRVLLWVDDVLVNRLGAARKLLIDSIVLLRRGLNAECRDSARQYLSYE